MIGKENHHRIVGQTTFFQCVQNASYDLIHSVYRAVIRGKVCLDFGFVWIGCWYGTVFGIKSGFGIRVRLAVGEWFPLAVTHHIVDPA